MDTNNISAHKSQRNCSDGTEHNTKDQIRQAEEKAREVSRQVECERKAGGEQLAGEANSAELTDAFTEEQNECENEKEPSDQVIKGFTQTVNQLELELSARKSEILKLQEENIHLKKVRFGFKKVKNSDSTVKFLTGLPALGVFLWVVSLIGDKVKKCSMALSVEDHTLIVLMKLKLGVMNKDIAFRYGCTESMISKVSSNGYLDCLWH